MLLAAATPLLCFAIVPYFLRLELRRRVLLLTLEELEKSISTRPTSNRTNLAITAGFHVRTEW